MLYSLSKRIFLLLALVFCQFTFADDNKQDLLSLAIGNIAIFDIGDVDEPRTYKLEYRSSIRPFRWGLAPGVGAAFSEDNANFFFLFLEKDFNLTNRWQLSVNFGPGLFNDGEDVILGNDLEFRSGIRIGYRFKNNIRAGFELFHLSNGGISDRNPGTEPAFIALYIPI